MRACRRWPSASLAVVGFVASATGARSALAEPRSPPIVVELSACDPLLAAEVRRIVGVELRAVVSDAPATHEAVTRVLATCRGSEVDLWLEEAVTAKHVERTVALSEAAPTARPRLVALAVAELVVASQQEDQRAPEPSWPSSGAPATLAPGPEHASATAEAIGIVRAFPPSGLWLLGAGARGLLSLSGPFTLTLEMTAEWGAASRATGQVAVRTLGGALGLGWLARRKWVFVMPWAGAGVGVARLQGEPNSGSSTSGRTQSGSWLGPEIGVAATVFPHAAVHATVALSGGATLLGVRGEVAGDSDVDVLGPWAALVIGVGLTKP